MMVARRFALWQFTLARIGWGRAIALSLVVAAMVVGVGVLPLLFQQQAADQQALQRAKQSVQRVILKRSTSAESDRLAAFYDALGDQRYAEQHLKMLFTLAQKNSVIINAAEYKTSVDPDSQLIRWQITFPAKGSYHALRQFCEQILLAMPFASLDELRFQRETIASAALDARVRFTLYLSDAPIPFQDFDR